MKEKVLTAAPQTREHTHTHANMCACVNIFLGIGLYARAVEVISKVDGCAPHTNREITGITRCGCVRVCVSLCICACVRVQYVRACAHECVRECAPRRF